MKKTPGAVEDRIFFRMCKVFDFFFANFVLSEEVMYVEARLSQLISQDYAFINLLRLTTTLLEVKVELVVFSSPLASES